MRLTMTMRIASDDEDEFKEYSVTQKDIDNTYSYFEMQLIAENVYTKLIDNFITDSEHGDA
jgi:hypothetical protein